MSRSFWRKVAHRSLDTAVADDASCCGVASRPGGKDLDAWPSIPKPKLRSPCIGSVSARAPDRSPPSPRIRAVRCWPIGSRRRRPHCRHRSAGQRRGGARGLRLPAGAAGGAAGRARRAGRAEQQRAERQFARRQCASHLSRVAGDEARGASGDADARTAAAQSRPGRAAADLSRRSQGALRRRARRRDRLCRAVGLVLVEPFLRVGRQGQRAPDLRRLRARGDPRRTCSAASPTCCSPSRPSGDAGLSRQCALDRPDSVAGLRQQRGLNENLAREILELHTLGVRTGLHPGRRHALRQGAHRLDRVPFSANQDRRRAGGEFEFNARMHQPGSAEGDRQDLSRHRRRAGPRGAGRSRAPSRDRQARGHQARAPFRRRRAAAGAGRAAGRRFLDTEGDLKEVAKALVDRAGGLGAPRAKLKRPSEWIVGTLRARSASAPPERSAR